jgi:hypothetical protein
MCTDRRKRSAASLVVLAGTMTLGTFLGMRGLLDNDVDVGGLQLVAAAVILCLGVCVSQVIKENREEQNTRTISQVLAANQPLLPNTPVASYNATIRSAAPSMPPTATVNIQIRDEEDSYQPGMPSQNRMKM